MYKFFIIALTLILTIFTSSVASAQYERDLLIPVDSINYNLHTYPKNGESFFNLPYDFEVKFNIVNGKYYYILFEDTLGEADTDLDIYFYTNDNQLIAKQHVKSIINSYNIPQNKKSIRSGSLKVRIINRDKLARNFQFVVAQSKHDVKGSPFDPNTDCNQYNHVNRDSKITETVNETKITENKEGVKTVTETKERTVTEEKNGIKEVKATKNTTVTEEKNGVREIRKTKESKVTKGGNCVKNDKETTVKTENANVKEEQGTPKVRVVKKELKVTRSKNR